MRMSSLEQKYFNLSEHLIEKGCFLVLFSLEQAFLCLSKNKAENTLECKATFAWVRIDSLDQKYQKINLSIFKVVSRTNSINASNNALILLSC